MMDDGGSSEEEPKENPDEKMEYEEEPKKKEPKTSLPSNPKDGRVYNVKTTDVGIDPERFQFKLNTNDQGVNEELRAAKKYNPHFAGVISVWKDPANGKTYVINGHHRYDKALSTGHKELNVKYIDAKNATEARAMGALINIAEGRGTAIDAAKFMRDTERDAASFEEAGISLKGKLASDATALAALSPTIFKKLIHGTIEENRALSIGKELKSPELQDQLVRVIDKQEGKKGGRELSDKVVAEMAREMAATPTHKETESSLFGDVETEHSLFVPRNELKNFIRTELGKDKKDFEVLSSERRAANVTRGGNTLNTSANKAIAKVAAVTVEDFSREANVRGELSDSINEHAAMFAKARTPAEKEKVKRSALAAVKKKLKAANA